MPSRNTSRFFQCAKLTTNLNVCNPHLLGNYLFFVYNRFIIWSISFLNIVQERAGQVYLRYKRPFSRKGRKIRKFRANEYRVKFTRTMLSASEIL